MEDLLQAKPAGANVTASFVNDPNFINQYPNTYNYLSKYSNWNGDYFGYLQYMADHGDAGATDKLFNYIFEQDAREYTAGREDTQYQRLVEDLRKAGINPYILMQSGASPISSQASGQSGSQFSNYELKKEQNKQGWLKAFISMLPMFAAVIAAAL